LIAALIVAGCGSDDRVTSATGVLEVEVLPMVDLCEIQGHQLSCADTAAYLRSALEITESAPLTIVWKGGVPPDQPRMTAVFQRLKGAGFRKVELVSLATYSGGSSPADG
jgi:hypothetical protein